MEYRQVTGDYAVSGQVAPEDVAAIKAAGFKGMICNRPDDEQPGQPSAATVGKAAETAGLKFRHVPFTSGQMTEDHVEAMARALDEMEGPIFAYCRSGARSTNVYLAAKNSDY